MKFRTLMISLLVLVTLQINGQDSMKLVSVSSVYGISYKGIPITKWSDGRFDIECDSLTAIKLLWKEIERRDSVHNYQMNKMFGFISDLQKDRRRMIEGLNKIQKILTVKP